MPSILRLGLLFLLRVSSSSIDLLPDMQLRQCLQCKTREKAEPIPTTTLSSPVPRVCSYPSLLVNVTILQPVCDHQLSPLHSISVRVGSAVCSPGRTHDPCPRHEAVIPMGRRTLGLEHPWSPRRKLTPAPKSVSVGHLSGAIVLIV